MAQFDLFRHARNKRYPLLLDLQADLLRGLATRIRNALEEAHTLKVGEVKKA